MTTIMEQWEIFRKATVSPKAGEGQIRDLRNTFFSGAAIMLKLSMEFSDDSLTDEEGAALLDKVSNEIQEYFTQGGIYK